MAEAKNLPPKPKQNFWGQRGLKWRLFLYLLSFVALLLVLLWFFQIVYLETFYERSRLNQIAASAQIIERNIDNPNIQPLLEDIAESQNLCIQLYQIREAGDHVLANMRGGVHILPSCQIHAVDGTMLRHFYDRTRENDGFYTQIFNRIGFHDFRQWREIYIGRIYGNDERGLGDSVVQGRIFQDAAGMEYFLLLNSNITPVGATIDTLQQQLQWITFLMIAITLVMSFFISRRLAAPISRINESAKKLAHSDFSVSFDGQGYRETVELADTLNYAAIELSRTERLQQELIANTSHDLRTPLTMIAGYAEAMRDLPNENTPENAQVIINEVQRLTALVNSVLDLSKISSGVDSLKCEVYNLTESVAAVVDNYSRLAMADARQIIFEYIEEAWVWADDSKMMQVVGNFLNNALTYSEPGQPVIVRQTIDKAWLRLEVIDQGEGIPADQLPDIWERYYRSNQVHKRSKHGWGMGLAIVRSILEQHGARYGVESELNQSSTFWFELPLAPNPEDEE